MPRVISGGQTGADQAGWRAAASCGVATGGWMPRGFLTEAGPRPDFAALYGAREHASREYPPRTEANAAWADVTLWFGPGDSAGFWCTKKAADRHGKPFWCVLEDDHPRSWAIRLREAGVRVVNVAGHRESSSPGIGVRAEEYLVAVFRSLGRPPRAAGPSSGIPAGARPGP